MNEEYTVVVNDDSVCYYKPGTKERHRIDGPAIERNDGYNQWYLNGKRHRENGPAIENVNGIKEWYLDGKRHRENGPAYENEDGDKYWYKNGLYHRTDGPAIEYSCGKRFWFVEGKDYSEEEFNSKMNICSCQCYKKDCNEETTKAKMDEEYHVTVDEMGTIRYYNRENSYYHRLDGPAIERRNGDKVWFVNGEKHREDGPACEWVNGNKEWFIEGKRYTEEEFNSEISKDPKRSYEYSKSILNKNNHIIEINEKKATISL